MKNMKKHEKLKSVAGVLLIVSAITHVVQIFVVGFEWHDIGAAFYGSTYGILGILLIIVSSQDVSTIMKKVITLGGIIWPLIGGILGLNRLINIELKIHGEINWFIIFHVIIDSIVIPICIYSLLKLRRS